jgi:hypothetical protein
MLVEFINPEGRKNSADLSIEQVNVLKKTEGYVVLEKKPRIHISDSACVSCEG